MNRIALTLLAALLLASPAFAHAHLTSETPADGSVASPAPTQLVLKFSEGVSLKFSGVAVTGPSGAAIAVGATTLAPKDDSRLTVPLTQKLAPGAYHVAWHALSTDGHKTGGSYSFTVK